MRRFAAVIALGVNFSVASAAGSYDGKWVGTAPEAGDCGLLTVTLFVKDNAISGTVSGKHGAPAIDSGTIAADGTALVTYAPGAAFKGNLRFSGNQFAGNFNSVCGTRAVTGSRSQ